MEEMNEIKNVPLGEVKTSTKGERKKTRPFSGHVP